jgi:hypothetical protein
MDDHDHLEAMITIVSNAHLTTRGMRQPDRLPEKVT